MWIILGIVLIWLLALALCRTAAEPEHLVDKQMRNLLEHAKTSSTIQ